MKCKYCEKHFQIKTKFLEQKVFRLKKYVGFKKIIAEVIYIPYSKVPLNNRTVTALNNLKNSMDDLMLAFTNRGQYITLKTLKVSVERITKQDISENIFRPGLSVNQDNYSLTKF